MGLYRNYIGIWKHKTDKQGTTCIIAQKELPYTQYSLLKIKEENKMFRVENIESLRSGRPVANQFKIAFDTAVGRVLLFQSYDTPIAMTVSYRVNGVLYYIATDKKYSRTTTKYQNMFYKQYGKFIIQQLTVSNFSKWIEALHNQALFNALLLKKREKQGASTK